MAGREAGSRDNARMALNNRHWIRSLQGGALALAAAYLAVGVLWILSSDQLGQVLFTSHQALTSFQTRKGLAFVAATAVFLYAVLARRSAAHRPVAPRGNAAPVVALLALLVLATALPLVVMLGWYVVRETRGQVESAEQLVRNTAAGSANDVAAFFDGKIRVAAALALRSGVRRLDPEACDPVLQDVAVVQDPLLEVSTFDREGRLVCGHVERRGQPAPAWMATMVRTGMPVVGPAERNPFLGVWGFTIAHPIFDHQGAVVGAVALVLPANVLLRLVTSPMASGSVIALLDERGAIAGRFPASPEFLGEPLRDPEVRKRLYPVPRPDTFIAKGVDGVERLYAAEGISRSRWVAVAGVPVENIFGPARQAFLRSLLVGLTVVALCVWLVLRLARSITAPLDGLKATAERAATGDFSHRAPPAGPAELAAVAAGFNHMLERLPELQQQLRESEARHREMIDKLSRHLPGVIYVAHVDAAGAARFPLVSAGVRQLFELEPEDLAHDAAAAVGRIHPDDRRRVRAALVEAGRGLEPFNIEYRVVLPRAGLRHQLSQAHPERGEGGGTIWYGAVTDITDLRNAQQALEAANATLEQRIARRTAALVASNEALESFSYSVAHDLRAPLASIDGFAQGMVESLHRGEAERALGYGQRVMANAGRMNLLIDGFLALAHASRAPLVDSPVDLQRVVAEVLDELKRPAGTCIEIGPLPRVLGDQATLRQVWQNLLSNAVKYSSKREQPLVVVGCDASGSGELTFWVRDNGAGFDLEYAGKLFTPFGRLHKAEEFEGTGVGLALVRRIVERHGGRIWAHSRPGEGATFTFTMPRERML